MKIESLVVESKGGVKGFGQNENRKERVERMKRFWNEPANKVLHPVGKILAMKSGGKSLAQWLLEGQEIEMSEVQVGGVKLPLVAGFKLSLSNLAQVWGCPACRSAHGSGVYPSREKDKRADLLEENRFFYNPSTKALFVISATCWKDYVEKNGAATDERFSLPVARKVAASEAAKGSTKVPAVA